MQTRSVILSDCTNMSKIATRECVRSFGNSLSITELETHSSNSKSDRYFIDRLDTDMLILAETGKGLVGYLQVCDMNLHNTDFKWYPKSRLINAIYIS